MKRFRIQATLRMVSSGLFVMIALASCGSADLDVDDAEPAEQLGGVYTVIAASDSNGTIVLGQPPTVIIETEFSALQIDAGCNDHFGSFTMADDGTASFTVAGQTSKTCDPQTDETERRIIEAFGQTNRWTKQAQTLELLGDNTAMTLER